MMSATKKQEGHPEHQPIEVGLAAFGMSGRVFHAPLLSAHKGFRLRKVLDRSGSKPVGERYPETEVVRDFEAVIGDEAIELVIINTPEDTHYAMGRKALLAGKHVVIEKAFTVTSQEARSLITLAGDQNRMLSVFQNSRWHGDFITIRSIIDQGLLGRLVEFEAHFDRFRNYIQPDSWKEAPKPGTGSLYNLGAHIIDQALVLFGWPVSVWADIRIQRPGGKVPDYFEVILNYEGLKVTLKSSYLTRAPGPRYLMHGTEGSFIKYGLDPQEAWLKAGKSPLEEDYGHEGKSQWGQLNTDLNGLHLEASVETLPGSYLGFYENIYGVLREKKALIVTAEQALQTIRIMEAAVKSQEEKRWIMLEPLKESPWRV